jgi:hypothetical protein
VEGLKCSWMRRGCEEGKAQVKSSKAREGSLEEQINPQIYGEREQRTLGKKGLQEGELNLCLFLFSSSSSF